MAERIFEVKTYKIVLDCDKCGGEMKPTGICLTSNPPQYPHVCQSCGNGVNILGKTYPRTELLEI